MNRTRFPAPPLTRLAARIVKPLAAVSMAGMLVVLVMGATVTNTGSARGCADTWPLCRGQFIPQFAVSTAIEFSHRSVVAILSVLIVSLAICVWLLFWENRELRLLAAIMVVFLFVQAGLGAWAVMSPQNAAVLALHFGVSLIAFASVVLVAASILLDSTVTAMRHTRLPRHFAAYIWTTTIFSYGVVYLGAYVRHRNADGACSGWPLCNGQVIPDTHGLVGPNFAHRLAALVLTIGVAGALYWSWRIRESRPDLYRASLIAGVLVVLQALSGALVVASHLDLFSALTHAGLVALLFGTLAYLCLQVTPVPEPRAATAKQQVRAVEAV